jgi:hypothetical protein
MSVSNLEMVAAPGSRVAEHRFAAASAHRILQTG